MTANQHPSVDPRLAEEAAQWLIDLEDDPSADLSRFAAWLKASPRHVEEFLLASAVWTAGDAIDPERRIDIERLIAQARGNVQPIEPLSAKSERVPGARRRVWSAVAATVAAVGVAVLLWQALDRREVHYVTGIGEQRAFKLQDGSIVTLNTRSDVRVRYTAQERLLDLVDGEALFSVHHDAERPFRVIAGGAVVQAIGTRFNVRRSSTGTTVAVVEGVVQVAPVATPADASAERIAAGEQARLSIEGTVLAHSSVEIDRVMAWRDRHLVFRDEPLAAVADEFNRYNLRPLVVEGIATRARLMNGVFDADDPAALIGFLERDPQLSVHTTEDSVVIRGP